MTANSPSVTKAPPLRERLRLDRARQAALTTSKGIALSLVGIAVLSTLVRIALVSRVKGPTVRRGFASSPPSTWTSSSVSASSSPTT